MEFDYPWQKRKMKRDLNLEGFSVSGSIIDFFALRKIIPDYRPINRRPDKILKYPLIISLTVHLYTCLFQPRQKQTFETKMVRRRRGKFSLDKTTDKSA